MINLKLEFEASNCPSDVTVVFALNSSSFTASNVDCILHKDRLQYRPNERSLSSNGCMLMCALPLVPLGLHPISLCFSNIFCKMVHILDRFDILHLC